MQSAVNRCNLSFQICVSLLRFPLVRSPRTEKTPQSRLLRLGRTADPEQAVPALETSAAVNPEYETILGVCAAVAEVGCRLTVNVARRRSTACGTISHILTRSLNRFGGG